MPTQPTALPTAVPDEGNTLLLTTTDPESGTARTTTLGYVRRGDALLVDRSGSPDWYGDLLAHPVVGVAVGTRAYQALAIPAEGTVVLEPAVPSEGESPREVRTLADKILEVHDQLRFQLRLVTADVDAHFADAGHEETGQPPAVALGFQIRQRCLAFCQALDFHHTSEDGHLFPGIAQYHPHLTDVFDRLRAEHRAVARIQDGLVALLVDIGTAEPGRFRAELAQMTTELNAHLDYEEEVILPLVAEVPWPPVRP